MKWLRIIVGPQPVLRLIALLLAVIACLLFLILQETKALRIDIPTVEDCGSSSNPCHVTPGSSY